MTREKAIKIAIEKDLTADDDVSDCNIEDFVNTIYDEIENCICANCIYQNEQTCDVFDIGYSIDEDFGCNKFKGDTK